jgi:hypothetical protein
MKKLIAAVLILTGFMLGSTLLKSEETRPSRQPVAQERKVDHQEYLKKMMSALHNDIKKTILSSVVGPGYVRRDDYENKNFRFGLEKTIKPEDEAARGASANLYLDQYRNAERFNVSAYYGKAVVNVNHNLKSRTGFVSLTVGQKDSLEIILNNYKDPIFKASAHVGKYSRVSGFYDSASKNLLTSASTNYKGLNASMSWMPQMHMMNAAITYSLPKDYNAVVKSLSVTHTSMPGMDINSFQANSRLGPVNVSAGINNSRGKYSPAINFIFRKNW